jgi:hypothetical protein
VFCGHFPEGFLIRESTASGAIQRRYAYGLGSNDILNQMNVAAATRATPDGDRTGVVIDRKSGALR